jgi:hypothetical protein
MDCTCVYTTVHFPKQDNLHELRRPIPVLTVRPTHPHPIPHHQLNHSMLTTSFPKENGRGKKKDYLKTSSFATFCTHLCLFRNKCYLIFFISLFLLGVFHFQQIRGKLSVRAMHCFFADTFGNIFPLVD